MLPDVHYGTVLANDQEAPLIDEVDSVDDDLEMPETDENLVAILGFDPVHDLIDED